VQIASDPCEPIEERINNAVAEGQYPQVFELLARTYYGMVFRHCASMLGGEKARAEDATQHVFVEVGKGIGKFRGEASVKSWLLAIAHKVCLAYIDKNVRRFHLWHRHQDTIAYQAHLEPPQEPEAEWLADDRQQWLAEALNQLPPVKRSLVVMRFGIGLPHEASIAELEQIVGRSQAAIYRDLKDALAALKQHMHYRESTRTCGN
jgi:RNA polymerase sigma-70 factor (ECF subfamily)